MQSTQLAPKDRWEKTIDMGILYEIREIYKDHWLVKSQTTPGKKYHIWRLTAGVREFACTCDDNIWRAREKPECKHIDALKYSMILYSGELKEMRREVTKMECAHPLDYTTVIRKGKWENKAGEEFQKYHCNECGDNFKVNTRYLEGQTALSSGTGKNIN